MLARQRLVSLACVRNGLVARSAILAGSSASASASRLLFNSLRTISTERLSNDQASERLVDQRKHRPLSPDLQIYKPQLTWILSSLHRLTGLAIGGAFYLYTLSYALLPLVGYAWSPAGLAAAVASLPLLAKFALKFVAASPFAFHCWNGIRHLIWDAGKALSIPEVYRTGYAVLGLTAVTTLVLALY